MYYNSYVRQPIVWKRVSICLNVNTNYGLLVIIKPPKVINKPKMLLQWSFYMQNNNKFITLFIDGRDVHDIQGRCNAVQFVYGYVWT